VNSARQSITLRLGLGLGSPKDVGVLLDLLLLVAEVAPVFDTVFSPFCGSEASERGGEQEQGESKRTTTQHSTPRRQREDEQGEEREREREKGKANHVSALVHSRR
jgi:hypothetical protein